MNDLYGFYPAKILSYNADKKTVQVEIPPYTHGAEDGIEAKIAYPIGDCDFDTERLIEPNMDTWVFFEQGHFNSPVVAFYRTHAVGSVKDVRRIRQQRIELIANEILLDAANLHITGLTTADDDVLAKGVSLVKHPHSNVQAGSGNSGPPKASD